MAVEPARNSVDAAFLLVGTELVQGTIQDSHARYLGGRFRQVGISLRQIVFIPDDEDQYRRTLKDLSERFDLVVITGGLGPTSDDLTREMVAGVAGVPLTFRDESWQRLAARFVGRELPASNRKQALIPEGFRVLRNDWGTADGFAGRVGSALVAALPGPPRELQPMTESRLLPLLAEEFSLSPEEELPATSFVLPESRLEDLIAECRVGAVSWGTRVESTRIPFILRGGSGEERREMLGRIRERAGALYVREGDVTAEELVTRALASAGLRLVTAESCTGGLASKLITDRAGSSEVFWGGFVTYDNSAKVSLLDVPIAILERYGAVSGETVAAMTAGALGRGGDVALAVSGIAGPGGGTPEKPVGTVWLAVRKRGEAERTFRFLFRGTRDYIRRKAAVTGLLLVESYILDDGMLDSLPGSEYI